jgi:hypothetical protein
MIGLHRPVRQAEFAPQHHWQYTSAQVSRFAFEVSAQQVRPAGLHIFEHHEE